MVREGRVVVGVFSDTMWVRKFMRPLRPWLRVQLSKDGAMFRNERTEMGVIVSGDVEGDGRRWLHLSASFVDRIPTYYEMVDVRNAFLGRDRKCVQVIAADSEHVNIHPYTLHLWHTPGKCPLPDFTQGSGSI